MKFKALLAIAAMFVVMLSVSAAEKGFQVGFWFDAPAGIGQDSVKGGVSLGIPISASASVKGAELSLIGSASKNMEGFQYAWIGFNKTRTLHGCQLAFVNFVDDGMKGVGFQVGFYNQSARNGFQFGFINNCLDNAKFQFGLVNINNNGWLPVMIFVNFEKGFFSKN